MMDHEGAVAAALQLQHDAGVMTSNLQVLDQFVSSLNRVSVGQMYELCPLLPRPSSIAPAMNIPLGCVYLTLYYVVGLAEVRLYGCCDFTYKL